jgi:RNA polymerase sigma factor (TIGR02999 family)
LKLVDQKRIPADSRARFFAVAAKSMRHILCNYAKHRRRIKRGGDVAHVTFEEDVDVVHVIGISEEQTELLDALDDALRKLEQVDKRQSEIVECRFFGGMSIDDTAVALDASPATIKRHWALARAWLYREMKLRISAPPRPRDARPS